MRLNLNVINGMLQSEIYTPHRWLCILEMLSVQWLHQTYLFNTQDVSSHDDK